MRKSLDGGSKQGKRVVAEVLGKDLSTGTKSHAPYKGVIDLLSQKEKLKSEKEQHAKQLNQFVEYQASLAALEEESDDDLAGRSVT